MLRLKVLIKNILSNSKRHGFKSCSRIEDITSYQNALSRALLVSVVPNFRTPFIKSLWFFSIHHPISRPSSSTLQARWLKLSKMTGCIPLCTVRFSPKPIHNQSKSQLRSFSFVEKTSEEANWTRNWSSAFYLDVKTSSYIHQTEFYACKQISNCIPRSIFFHIFIQNTTEKSI